MARQKKGYPLFDDQCVESQAEVLIPNIVEAGVQVMKLFVPQVNVTITSCEGKTVQGFLSSVSDPEYPKSLTFNGQIKIINKSKSNAFDFLEVKNGNFSGTVSKMTIEEGDKISASFDVGGLTISSLNDFTAKKDLPAGTATLGSPLFVPDTINSQTPYNMYTIKSTSCLDGEINIEQRDNSNGKVWGVLKIRWNKPPGGNYLVANGGVFWRLTINFDFETIEDKKYIYTPNVNIIGLSGTSAGASGGYDCWRTTQWEPNFCLKLAPDNFTVSAGKVVKYSLSKTYDITVQLDCGASGGKNADGYITFPMNINNYFDGNFAVVLKYLYPRD